ncbi:hypothetical protein [Geobacter sp.]|uniref:hypothetical protein n=1 Tax=Geobacter sp. TaxID=46610 RepID=UPI0026019F5A|nr:hypothetical protein [Geobacter sp.]
MRLFVKYDKQGKITSTAKVATLTEGVDHPYIDIGKGESVIEVPATKALETLTCEEIHGKYRVDVNKKKLVKGKG